MIAPAWAAAAITTGVLLVADVVNRRWVGFLPDDPPRPGRKQHARPMPLAGVLLAPVIAFWMLADPFWDADRFGAAAVLVAAAVGFLDDRSKQRGRDFDWRWKAVGLLLASGLAAGACTSVADGLDGFLVRTLIAFVLVNAVNFLDNTDGVAVGIAATCLLLFANGSGGWPAAAGFAALAFVPWNWPRPRLFLGDAGAYALGITLAIAIGFGLTYDWAALAFAAIPLLDFSQVVLVRLWLRHPPWVGDRRHLTHVAQNLGVPRVAVAPLFAALAGAAAWVALRTR